MTLDDAGTAVGSGHAPSGTWSAATGSLADGSHTITATDLAGNTSVASASSTVTVDTVAPSPPSKPTLASSSDAGISTSDGITKDTTPTFAGTTEKRSIVTLYDGATSVAVSGAVNSGNHSLTTSTLSSAIHTVTATATDVADVAGNTSAPSTPTTVTVDSVAPTLTVNQAAGRADPALVSPVAFTAVFSETVYGLTAGDVTLTGTAGATTTAITGKGSPTPSRSAAWSDTGPSPPRWLPEPSPTPPATRTPRPPAPTTPSPTTGRERMAARW